MLSPRKIDVVWKMLLSCVNIAPQTESRLRALSENGDVGFLATEPSGHRNGISMLTSLGVGGKEIWFHPPDIESIALTISDAMVNSKWLEPDEIGYLTVSRSYTQIPDDYENHFQMILDRMDSNLLEDEDVTAEYDYQLLRCLYSYLVKYSKFQMSLIRSLGQTAVLSKVCKLEFHVQHLTLVDGERLELALN